MQADRGPALTPSYNLGLILVTISAVAWSTAGLFTRLIPVDIPTMLVWRGLFGAISVFVFALILERDKAVDDFRHMGWPGWTFALISAFGMLCYIASLRITTVAHVSIIYATVPLVAAALAWIVMGEHPTKSALVASLFALVGVGIIVGFGHEGDPFGDLLAFGMTLSMAILMVIARRYQNIPIMPAACLSALLSAVVAMPFTESLAVSPSDLGMLALFGIVNSAVGISLFTLGSKMLPAVETALIGTLDAPLAPIWVWLVFAETPGRETLIGGTIVFTVIFIHVFVQSRKAQRQPAVIST